MDTTDFVRLTTPTANSRNDDVKYRGRGDGTRVACVRAFLVNLEFSRYRRRVTSFSTDRSIIAGRPVILRVCR